MFHFQVIDVCVAVCVPAVGAGGRLRVAPQLTGCPPVVELHVQVTPVPAAGKDGAPPEIVAFEALQNVSDQKVVSEEVYTFPSAVPQLAFEIVDPAAGPVLVDLNVVVTILAAATAMPALSPFVTAVITDWMFHFVARAVPEYAAAICVPRVTRSLSLLGSAPLEKRSFGANTSPPEFVCPCTRNPTEDPVSAVTHDAVAILGIARRFTTPPVLTRASIPLYVPFTYVRVGLPVAAEAESSNPTASRSPCVTPVTS